MTEGSDYSQYHHMPLYTTDLVTHVANGTYLCRVRSSLKVSLMKISLNCTHQNLRQWLLCWF